MELNDVNELFELNKFIVLLERAYERRKKCKESCEIYDMCFGGCNANTYLEGCNGKTNYEYCEEQKYIILSLRDEIMRAINLPDEMLNPRFRNIIHV